MQNNNPNYKKENWAELQKLLSDGCMIYDFWNQLDNDLFIHDYTYNVFGRK